jgi:hypothetical protein
MAVGFFFGGGAGWGGGGYVQVMASFRTLTTNAQTKHSHFLSFFFFLEERK